MPPPMTNLDAAQDAAAGTCREGWKGDWSGAGAGLKERAERLEGGMDGGPVNWKRGLCWSGSWKGERKIAGRELEGEERSEKSWKGGTLFLDGDRNLERALEGGEEFSTTQPETGRGLEGGFARFVAKMLEGDWKGTSPSRSQSNFFRAVMWRDH